MEYLKDSARQQLQRILKTNELDSWIFTDVVQVVYGEDAHSKPILTMNANHLDDDEVQLAVFIHENAHWYVGDDKTEESEQTVIAELKERYPYPPEPEQKNLYHHIMVAWITYDALIELFGKKQAQVILDRKVAYYTSKDPHTSLSRNFIWYHGVAIRNANEVGKVMKDYGFNINPERGIIID